MNARRAKEITVVYNELANRFKREPELIANRLFIQRLNLAREQARKVQNHKVQKA